MARTDRTRAPMRGWVMRLPGATVSRVADDPVSGAGGVAAAAGRLQTAGSAPNAQTGRAALRMSPARVACTGWSPVPWATKVAWPAASAVAATAP